MNGELGVLLTIGGMLIGVVTFDLDGGLITDLRFQLNPEKLHDLRP